MPRIFISYRRSDSEPTARHLHDRFAQIFGHQNIFMDVDDIPIGMDFRMVLGDEIGKVDVLLIIIGPRWVSEMKQRLSDSNDFVRYELQNALKQGKRVIPVLVDGATMPAEAEFDGEIPSDFFYLNAAYLSRGKNFNHDLERLIAELRKLDVPVKRSTPKLPVWVWGVVAVAVLVIGLLVTVTSNNNPPTLTPSTDVAQLPTETVLSQNFSQDTSTNTLTSTPELTNTQSPTPTLTNSPTPTYTLTKTPTNLPTATATIGTPIARIIADVVNLRTGPDTVYEIKYYANQGDVFEVVGYRGQGEDRWYLVKTKDEERVWVYGGSVNLLPTDAAISPIPFIIFTPTTSSETIVPSISTPTIATANFQATQTRIAHGQQTFAARQATQTATNRPIMSTPRSTLTLTPTFTPYSSNAFQGIRAIVNVSGANLRNGPGIEYTVIGAATNGTSLLIIAYANDVNKDKWYIVEYENGNRYWISSKVVNISDSDAGVFYISQEFSTSQTSEITVSALLGWQNSRVEVEMGDLITIEAIGQWAFGPAECCPLISADGGSRLDGLATTANSILPLVRLGTLIAQIGDSPYFAVGKSITFVSPFEGFVYFNINDEQGLDRDNRGELNVTITKLSR